MRTRTWEYVIRDVLWYYGGWQEYYGREDVLFSEGHTVGRVRRHPIAVFSEGQWTSLKQCHLQSEEASTP